ncbi:MULTISPECIES: PLP-dependent aminotransferase family protein [Clostridium]|jgi:2-aminoadipate transaminase|uniref:2-aminoadipate transaminase n=1 Tax=Clostridium ljungdahlii (strain ATCC 55383 / DSM 13528 / PETC) TaxID=748727 RepID=D8GIU6_CLOLD|nr:MULTISPECIES: PLP-dependent aminotransferase family protein [Clostridium]ADK15021.1 predicted transcriptional regulators containing a DNA-binding HTH domain and an aminotransferase domain [Clostridium ljungdahlii DSM 13528]ALU34464.1 Aminotransferase [Clostridium autoethanogenum DSM 10061]OAA87682.1 2-aminoadipate transaminase [Clostridium ljungdahlii DSM 13528]OVY51184.1 2-aminoadipate transaminase [Clostridium autoethanogenum]
MNYTKFSKRNNFVRPSEIREILKVTERPEIISFAGGLPAPELFPVNELKNVCTEVLTECGEASLQYSTTEGYIPLREAICKRMEKLSIKTSLDNIIVTTGSQQALDLSGKVFIDEGDTIICESPTYLAAISAFKTYLPNFKEIPMDEEGMIMEDLEKALKDNPNAKFIYTIPDFQNPTGRTMSLERRKKLVEIANKFDIVIIEDNPYGAIRFAGEDLPPVKHFDTEGRVIYLSTFSKIFAPGLRLGWICADKSIIQKYIPFKQSADLHTDIFAQMITAKYMEMYDIEEHIQKIKEVYRHRRELMIQCIEKYFPKDIKHTLPDGGLFIWIQLPSNMDASDIFTKAIKNNVAFVAGESFFPNANFKNSFRLNYSNMPDDRIIEGIKRLGEVLKK